MKYDISFKKPHLLYTTIRNFVYHLFKIRSKDLVPSLSPDKKSWRQRDFVTNLLGDWKLKSTNKSPKIKNPESWSGLLFFALSTSYFQFSPDKTKIVQPVETEKCPVITEHRPIFAPLLVILQKINNIATSKYHLLYFLAFSIAIRLLLYAVKSIVNNL